MTTPKVGQGQAIRLMPIKSYGVIRRVGRGRCDNNKRKIEVTCVCTKRKIEITANVEALNLDLPKKKSKANGKEKEVAHVGWLQLAFNSPCQQDNSGILGDVKTNSTKTQRFKNKDDANAEGRELGEKEKADFLANAMNMYFEPAGDAGKGQKNPEMLLVVGQIGSGKTRYVDQINKEGKYVSIEVDDAKNYHPVSLMYVKERNESMNFVNNSLRNDLQNAVKECTERCIKERYSFISHVSISKREEYIQWATKFRENNKDNPEAKVVLCIITTPYLQGRLGCATRAIEKKRASESGEKLDSPAVFFPIKQQDEQYKELTLAIWDFLNMTNPNNPTQFPFDEVRIIRSSGNNVVYENEGKTLRKETIMSAFLNARGINLKNILEEEKLDLAQLMKKYKEAFEKMKADGPLSPDERSLVAQLSRDNFEKNSAEWKSRADAFDRYVNALFGSHKVSKT